MKSVLISPERLQNHISGLKQQGLTHTQLAQHIDAIDAFIAWAFRKEYITKDLTQQLRHIIANDRLSTSKFTNDKPAIESASPHQNTGSNILDSHITNPSIRNLYSFAFIIVLLTILLGTIFASVFRKNQTVMYRSFQPTQAIAYEGQLTDSEGIPIISTSRAVFRLYPSENSTIPLYDSGICQLYPDKSGYIRIRFGGGCGKSVPGNISSQYSQLYMGITINGGRELSPRVRIPTVSYALEAQTLSGYQIPEKTATHSAALLADINEISYAAVGGNIPVINSEGNLMIAAENPRIWATSGTFQLRGQTLSLTTQEGSAGSITIAPDIGGNILLPTGNIGIATAEPTSFRLQIAGDIGPDADGIFTLGSKQKTFKEVYAKKFYGDGSQLTGIPQLFQEKNGVLVPKKVTSDILLGSNNASTARIKLSGSGDSFFNQGSVGIGTTAPSSVFEVVGTAQLRGSSEKAGLYVDKRGFVAIGSTNPSVNLDVGGEFKVTGKVIIGDATDDLFDIYAGAWQLRNPTSIDLADSQTQALNIESGLLNFDTTNGRVGIGTTTPSQKLHVRNSQSNSTIALIENTSTGSGADGLSIQLGFTGTGSTSNHFTTFLNGDGTLQGKIQSNGAGGITYSTSGSDFAEYFLLSQEITNLPEFKADERKYRKQYISAGTLICQYTDGRVGPCDANHSYVIGAVSDSAGFVGGAQNEQSELTVLVGLLGQLSIKATNVNGQIQPGDPLSASSMPGFAQKTSDFGRIVGFAQTKEENGYVHASILPSYFDPRLYLTSIGDISPEARYTKVYDGIKSGTSMLATLDDAILQTEQATIETAAALSNQLPHLFISSLDVVIIYSEKITASLIKAQKAMLTSLEAEDIVTKKLTSEQIDVMRLRTQQLSAQTATIAGTLQTDTLIANSATIAGTLTADSVSSKNIKELEQNQKTGFAELSASVESVQQNIAKLQHDPTPPVSNSPALENLPDDLVVYGTTTLFTANVMDTFTAGGIGITGDTLLSLSDNLKLTALNLVDILDGTLIVSRDGTVTINGTLLAQRGIRTNSIKGLTDNSDIAIELTNKDNKLSFKNNGTQVAAIDGGGNAHFGGISLDSYFTSSSEAKLVADSSTDGDTLVSSIQTHATSAGVAVLPAYARRVVIYNKRIGDKSLIYLSPTSDTKNKILFISSKQTCSAPDSSIQNDSCIRSFTVAIDAAIDTDISFNWWIIN